MSLLCTYYHLGLITKPMDGECPLLFFQRLTLFFIWNFQGRVVGFFDAFQAGRKFAMDMAGM